MSTYRAGIIWLGAAAITVALARAVAVAQDPEQGPVVIAGVYEPGGLGVIVQPALLPPPVGPAYSVGPYPLYTPELAEGDGRDLVLRYCGICHSTVYITMQPPLPRAAWEATVKKMIGVFGAPIPEDAASAITSYLAAHYSPETRVR
jgi:hypothetical protein